jgi:transposase InsO family protein
VSRKISVRQMAQFRLRVIRDAERLGNVTAAARLSRVSRQAVHTWITRYDGTLQSLMDRSRRPHSHPNQHTREEVRRVLSVARQNKRLGLVCLWMHLKLAFGYKRTVVALYRLLRREGVIPAPTKKHRRKPKPYEAILVPGERVQVDVKYVPQACLVGGLTRKKVYQYTAMDECTRWRYTAAFDELSTYNSVIFAKQLMKRFPFEIGCIQTDNGSEFTSRLQGAMHPSAFELYLAEQGIRHKLIAVATPRHNGKVERSHRTDDERFYQGNRFYNMRYLREQLERHRRLRNNTPMTVLGLRSPSEMLRRHQEAV